MEKVKKSIDTEEGTGRQKEDGHMQLNESARTLRRPLRSTSASLFSEFYQYCYRILTPHLVLYLVLCRKIVKSRNCVQVKKTKHTAQAHGSSLIELHYNGGLSVRASIDQYVGDPENLSTILGTLRACWDWVLIELM